MQIGKSLHYTKKQEYGKAMIRTLKWKLDCSRIKYTLTSTQNRLVFPLISTPGFKFEVLRLQRLFQNKKNHLYETSKPCHGLFSNNNKWLASYIYLFCTCSMHFGLVTITVRFLQGSLFEGWLPLIRRKCLLTEGAYVSVKLYGAH